MGGGVLRKLNPGIYFGKTTYQVLFEGRVKGRISMMILL